MAFIATAPLVRTVCAASIIDEMISGAEAVIRKRLQPMVVDQDKQTSGAGAGDSIVLDGFRHLTPVWRSDAKLVSA
jgi:hypothetical protein